MRVDGIIVGQGLAGTILAHRLQSHGQSVALIDTPHLSNSSAVAAGIWNPVVFKRLSKSWMADEVLPAMMDFYRACEQKLGTSLVIEKPIIRPFSEPQEISFWQKKAASDNPYLDGRAYNSYQLTPQDVVAQYGRVKGSGHLHVQQFLHSSRVFFEAQGACLSEALDHSEVQVSSEGVDYKHLRARYIVFCEGYQVRHNPFFRHIPFKPAKGEVLTIYCEDLQLESEIFNKNFFILPLGDHTYKVGATYEWQELNDLPTDQARWELLQKLNAVLHVPFEVIHHQAGVRPSVIDRRPVLGSHASYPNVCIFNGFGTKAVMLAPYFSEQLCGMLLHQRGLGSEVDVKRF